MAAVLPLLLGAAEPAQDWAAFRDAARALKSVKASFRQEKHMKILARPLVSEGRFLFQRPDSIRWEYEKPIASALLAHGGDVRRWVRKGADWIPDVSAQVESMRVVLAEIGLWVTGRFEESRFFEARRDPERPNVVMLVPKQPELARFLSRVVVTLGATPGVLASIELREGPDTSTRILFHDVEVDAVLPARRFQEVP